MIAGRCLYCRVDWSTWAERDQHLHAEAPDRRTHPEHPNADDQAAAA